MVLTGVEDGRRPAMRAKSRRSSHQESDERFPPALPARDPAEQEKLPAGTRPAASSALPCYSYIIHNGPGNNQLNPSRNRSRQFCQLCPSRASRYFTSNPASWSNGTSERFS